MNALNLRDSVRYGAVRTKIRALYGKRLKTSDYRALLNMRTLSEVASFLSAHPGYSHLMKDLPGEPRRDDLERALRREIYLEYERLYMFMEREDHPLIQLVLRREELTAILDYLCALNAGRPGLFPVEFPPFIKKRVSIDFDALLKTSSLAEGLPLLTKSIFFSVLSGLHGDSGGIVLPLLAEGVLLSEYYLHAMKTVEKHYTGGDGKFISQTLLREAELYNITTLLRIKKYFPDLTEELLPALIPLRQVNHPGLRRKILSAPSAEDAIRYLAFETSFKKFFSKEMSGGYRGYIEKYIYDTNLRLLRAGVPGSYIPIAYLALKEIEIRNIVHLVERVRYGVTPEDDPFVPVGT